MIDLPDKLTFRFPMTKGEKINWWPYIDREMIEDRVQELPDDIAEAYERIVLWLMIESRWKFEGKQIQRMYRELLQYKREYEVEEKSYNVHFVSASWNYPAGPCGYCGGAACEFYSYVCCMFYTVKAGLLRRKKLKIKFKPKLQLKGKKDERS